MGQFLRKLDKNKAMVVSDNIDMTQAMHESNMTCDEELC